jgi:putative phosphoesterase
MRIAIVADIHGNRRAFEAVLADLKPVAPDLIVHGGDLASGGAHPAEIIAQIRTLGWPGIRGNTDEMLWAPETLAAFAAANPAIAPLLTKVAETIAPTVAMIGQERLRWLEKLPATHTQAEFTLVHAKPGDLWRAPMPNASDEELRSTYESLNAPVAVYCHIHVPYVRRLAGMIVANTGSVSQSHDGDRRASYLLIDGDSVTNRRVEYDVESEAHDMMNSGIPHAEWIARILLAGKYVPPES